MSGKLILVIGPMMAGKSSELQRYIKRFTLAKKKCIIIKHSIDNRYGQPTNCCTHDKNVMPALALTNIDNQYIEDNLINYDVIGIDEGQFFDNIVEVCDVLVDKLNKIVIVSALDADWQGKPFGRIGELLCLCEEVHKLTAICVTCGNEASFTQRTSKSTDKILVGGSDSYQPICRKCRQNLDVRK